MRLEDFPRPKNDNRRGVHWSASVYHPSGGALDFWMSELEAMKIKWVKVLDDGGGSSMELCQRLLAADIMPIVRLYRLEPNPGHISGREEDTLRRLIAAGVRYFETNNEPDLPAEWKGGRMPPNWLDVVIDNFIYDADRVIKYGGLPALPATGVGSRTNSVEAVVQKGRADLFEKGVWVAIHNYTLNHPLEYPYDRVNQEGAPLSQEEYDRAGTWAWEGRPRELINQWRESDKNPGDTLADDSTCFLSFHLWDQMILDTLGHRLPILSTEGGPVVGWKDDRRYPRVDPHLHAEMVVSIIEFMQSQRQIQGIRCPESYFTMCPWLLANYRLGFMAPGWESQSWYTDWWNDDFGLSGEMPVVAALKNLPTATAVAAPSAVIAGCVLRADTNEPIAELSVRLLVADRELMSVLTAEDGTFRFERLPVGIYDLSIPPWGIVRRGINPADRPAHPVTIRLVGGRSSAFSGTVHSATGEPESGVRISLERGGTLVGETTSAPNGTFRFADLPLGTYRLSVPGITVDGIALDGWQSKSLRLTAGTAAEYRYAIVKQRLLSAEETGNRRVFFGTVCDAAGVPLNGVKVEMSWKTGEENTGAAATTTGSDPYRPLGSYELLHTPGVFSLRVAQGDWPSDVAGNLDTANVPDREGQPVAYEIDFRLHAIGSPAQVDGIIPGGQPGGRLTLVTAKEAPGIPPTQRETTLAADGTFVFPDLAPGTYRLELEGVGVVADPIEIETGALFKLVFPMRSRLTGRVLGPTPGEAAVLHSPGTWGWTRQSPLDPDGSFLFESLPPGRYRLEVADQTVPDLILNGENWLQLAPIDPMQGSRSIVRGRIADGEGKPQADILVVLRQQGAIMAQARTAADGLYRFENLPAGTYALEAVGLGEVAGQLVLDGEREHVGDVLMAGPGPRSILQGRVFTAEGQPVAGAVVRLTRGGADVAQAETDGAGGFRFPALPGDLYALVIGGAEPLATDVAVEEDATVTRDLVLPAKAPKWIAHYVLFEPPPEPGMPNYAEAKLVLSLASRYVIAGAATGGFNLADAAQASRVTIVGERVSATAEQTLQKAGCEVTRLTGDGYAIAAALEQLLATLGEG